MESNPRPPAWKSYPMLSSDFTERQLSGMHPAVPQPAQLAPPQPAPPAVPQPTHPAVPQPAPPAPPQPAPPAVPQPERPAALPPAPGSAHLTSLTRFLDSGSAGIGVFLETSFDGALPWH